jgi:hypothetical protein
MSLKSFAECAKEQKQILRSPPPNWKAFGAPFTQNDSLSFDDSLSFATNFWDRTPDGHLRFPTLSAMKLRKGWGTAEFC